uniref:ATP synthase complex subunit 8 n=1 Tax=Conocephalus melaenus TaxID=948344 RepID=A0A1Q1MPH8_9ORTH|nr:ATP synthase F0 subunit 8 [Conocephalus melaenus]AQM39983.1 ATP synthase F0 subunit 8 [Conocephalus melaenus]ATL57808.1 ATP synthase F0 subunit 8 [Conocephalus melaenus]
MPQMAPMSWLSLFLMFSLALMLFSVLKFYMISINSEIIKKTSKTSSTLNWKW